MPRTSNHPTGTLRVLKEESGRGVYLVANERGEREPNYELVKRWPATPWELFKFGIGIAQAQRQLRGATRLRAAGIATPEPRGPVRIAQGFVEIRLQWIEGTPLLERVRQANDDEQRSLGAATREVISGIERAGLFNRDGKLSNFIVTPDNAIVAIDPVGVRRSRNSSDERMRARESLACELSEDERVRAATFLSAASP